MAEKEMDQAVLEVRHLTTRLAIGQQAYPVVEDLSFSLYPGKTLAIVGESGCGKSMTALSLLRVLPQPPAQHPEGEVLLRGEDLLKLSEAEMRCVRGHRMSMIFQDPSSALNPVYTIGDQLSEVLELHLGMGSEESYERCIQALREVGIPSPEKRLQDYPHQLSGGMRQRVMIAMALLCQPEVLIADEPTTALDVTVQAQVLDLMRDLQRERGMALLLITHDLGVVAEMADEVLVMYASREVERGPVDTVFDDAGHPYTQGLFASRPRLHEHRTELTPIQGMVPGLMNYPEGCRFHPRCPHTMPRCLEGNVLPFPCDGVSSHQVACWLHDQEAKR